MKSIPEDLLSVNCNEVVRASNVHGLSDEPFLGRAGDQLQVSQTRPEPVLDVVALPLQADFLEHPSGVSETVGQGVASADASMARFFRSPATSTVCCAGWEKGAEARHA
eukprot:CAMPEP_0177233710 /NCGR_PEP_ID=MMETSP0367-20130122/44012_1 /TAXON_ID=447022 ORGANISM="Scrippsiella hangoei-like, Strain SHHI-4" /NCGR_SAMPLE_ID=MMETSP0367 /ASSEMBLY_ACC=CAM_ASM_000362 /LENGTH=108 /DNA_ID=CAMNT_0018684463 /DNA_START=208 /DNA_END=532 /DNA_ORIENTATION=+